MRQRVFLSVLLVCLLNLIVVHSKRTEGSSDNLDSQKTDRESTLNRRYGDDSTKRGFSVNYLAPYINFSRIKAKESNHESPHKKHDKPMWTNNYKFEYTGGDGGKIYEYPSFNPHTAPKRKSSGPSGPSSFVNVVKGNSRPEVVTMIAQPQPQQKQQRQQYPPQPQQQQQPQQQEQETSESRHSTKEMEVGEEEKALLHLDFVSEPLMVPPHQQQVKDQSVLNTMPFLRQFMHGMFSRFSSSPTSRKGQANPPPQSLFAKLQQIHHNQQQKSQQQHGKNVINRPIGMKLMVPYEMS